VKRSPLIVVCLAANPLVAQPAFFTGVGFLPNPNPLVVRCNAADLSHDGSTVVGTCQYLGLNEQAFRWTAATGIVGLGFLPGDDRSGASAVSADGSVITGWSATASTYAEGLIWTAAGGPNRFSNHYAHGEALDVSADGSIVVGYGGYVRFDRCFNVFTQSYYWLEDDVPLRGQNGGVQRLGGNSTAGVARAISPDGSTILGSSWEPNCVFNPIQHDTLWHQGTATHWTFPGSPADLSYDGSVIVGSADGVAFRWTQAGGLVSLGVLAGYQSSGATAVSVDGSVVVGTCLGAGSAVAPFIWDAQHGMRNLRDLLASAGVATTGWSSLGPVAISADGRTIAGDGINPAGHAEAWIARLGDPAPNCYANCDQGTTQPILNVQDFTCFLQRFAAGESDANCDQSTSPPVLNVADFTCFLQSFAAGCP
jgi:uncharacterized membrane protein